MDDRKFDSIARQLGAGSTRRSVLKGLLGIGGIAATGVILQNQTEAARRGFSGPTLPVLPSPTPTPSCLPDGDECTGDPSDCCSGTCCIRVNANGPGVCCTPPAP